nr:alpha/beta hydrolase [Anaerolineae bacterium]
MPTVSVNEVKLYYEEHGTGPTLLLLHAGWGLPVNGFDAQVRAFPDCHLVIPHRRGYGRSTPVSSLGPYFHRQAAADMLALLDALKVERAALWGHSDGAVIGAMMAIQYPDRVRALIFEGGHLYCRKPQTRRAFERVLASPESLPEAIQEALIAGHGVERWRQVLRNWAEAWLALGERDGDLYTGRLAEIRCPTLILHGAHDPHTAVAEIEALATQIPDAELHVFPAAGHSAHDDPATLEVCNGLVRRFLNTRAGFAFK